MFHSFLIQLSALQAIVWVVCAPSRRAVPLRAGSSRCCTARQPGCGSPHPPHRNAGASEPALPELPGRAGRASLGPPLRTAAGLARPCRGTPRPDGSHQPVTQPGTGAWLWGRALQPEESERLLRGWLNHTGPGKGVSADFAGSARCNQGPRATGTRVPTEAWPGWKAGTD